MSFDLSGRVIVVTGAWHPYGRAAVARFAEHGAQVVAVDRKNIGTLAEADGVHYRRADVADELEMGELLREVAAEHGRLDAVICAAGSEASASESPIAALDSAAFQREISANALSVLWVLKHAPRLMTEGGSIVTMVASTARTGAPTLGAHTAAEAAVLALSKSAALELAGEGIRVNTVVIGPFDTPYLSAEEGETAIAASLNPLGRMGRAEEIAGLFHYLASDESAFVTGAALDFDGGASAGAVAPNVLDALLLKTGTIGPFEE
jgi:NAD(P)-dependent dehydrogenase (short-subunit alcohol dehydrogenase family)